MLVDLYPALEVGRWQVAQRDSRDARRARSMLHQDLDAVEAVWHGYSGVAKAQLCGPLTMAANLELRSGDVMASDPAALGDLAASLAEGVVQHLKDVATRVPGATWWVQVDEPMLATVTGGGLARPSGWGAVPAMATADAVALLRDIEEAIGSQGAEVVIHCGEDALDWAVVEQISAAAVSVDLDNLDDLASVDGSATWAPRLEAWWASGRRVWFGVEPDDVEVAVAALRRVRSVLDVPWPEFLDGVVLTPTGSTGPVSARAYADLRSLMKRLHDST
jgi:hypothetical protein